MNEVQKALDAAFQALDVIPVSGQGVELMATARASLRAAYRLAEDRQGEEKKSTTRPVETALSAAHMAQEAEA